jgi:hypothetical protein
LAFGQGWHCSSNVPAGLEDLEPGDAGGSGGVLRIEDQGVVGGDAPVAVYVPRQRCCAPSSEQIVVVVGSLTVQVIVAGPISIKGSWLVSVTTGVVASEGGGLDGVNVGGSVGNVAGSGAG